jgi:uncharacterized membrane protein
MTIRRVEGFSDAVFAVAATLLIFSINPPSIASDLVTNGVLSQQVLQLWPKILAYIISFLVIGIFWMGHHIMFHYIKRANRTFAWLNVLLLTCVCFIPFAAALIGTYPKQEVSILVYGFTLTLSGLMYWVLWTYASRGQRLIAKDMDPALVRLGAYVVLTAPLVYAVATAVSLMNESIGIILFIIVPILYILPGPIDRLVYNGEEEV